MNATDAVLVLAGTNVCTLVLLFLVARNAQRLRAQIGTLQRLGESRPLTCGDTCPRATLERLRNFVVYTRWIAAGNGTASERRDVLDTYEAIRWRHAPTLELYGLHTADVWYVVGYDTNDLNILADRLQFVYETICKRGTTAMPSPTEQPVVADAARSNGLI